MNGKAHVIGGIIGGPAAGIATLIKANRQPTLMEVGGWFAAGVVGAKLPDLLEPAFCPTHRKFCHSGCMLALDLAALQSQTLQDMIEGLLQHAKRYHLMAQNSEDNQLGYKLCAYLLEFSAGALPGFLGSYASHLILDSTTPCGLPLV
jgi:membrane-bound metal-dependent hydrolase YbcI (DUF457 family)